jgi:cyclopropane fatty-acyl-phospholipid synthase-like methyltransferase
LGARGIIEAMNGLSLEARKQMHSGPYVEFYERTPLARLERLLPLMRLQGSESLVDFGCGGAMLLPIVTHRVASYSGVDFSSDFIDAARRRAAAAGIGNCEFFCEDIIAFCEAHPRRFDVATAFDFTEHVADLDLLPILGAIRGTLKPGGRLLLHTPNLEFIVERLKQWGVMRQFPEHIAVRTAAQLEHLLQQAGFEAALIRTHGLAHYNVLSALHPLRRLPGVGRSFVARLFIECSI